MKIKFEKIDDKALHVYAGVAISLIVGFLSYYFTEMMPIFACAIGVGAGTIVGVLKEVVWDKHMKKGTYSRLDMFSTFWGSLIGAIMLRVIIDLLEK